MRRVELDGWPAYKDVRLKALRGSVGFQLDPGRRASDDRGAVAEEGEPQRDLRATAGGAAVGLTAGIDGEMAGSAELVFDPGRRREGLGTRLISAVAYWAAACGFKTLARWVAEGNQAAENAFVRSAFGRTGRRQVVRLDEPDVEF